MAEKILFNPGYEIKNYPYKAAQETEFLDFCQNGKRDPQTGEFIKDADGKPMEGVRKWLQDRNAKAKFWTFKQGELALLVVAVDRNDTEWGRPSGPPGFQDFLQGDYDPIIKPLPALDV